MSDGALAGVKVLDLTDERSIYGAKLLADLGADVVRPEPAQGDPLRQRGPHIKGEAEHTSSLYYAFFASNRRFFTLPSDAKAAHAQLLNLIHACDIVLYFEGNFAVDTKLLDAARQQRPELIVVETSSFGEQGPWQDYLAPDLIAGALAGAVATTGDVDTPPLKAFGELNFMISGAYVAIAALAALYSKDARGVGQKAHVSTHECIASCLEQVFMFYWYADVLMREDKVLPRRGSTHWSDAFTVMNGKNGSIMVTPTPDFDAQLAWLIEEGVHDDLIDPKYMEPENLRLRIERTMEILQAWVAEKDVEKLFFEAQSRHSPYGWVLPLENVAENPQLDARGWYVPYRIGNTELSAPGAPYRFSGTPWSLRDFGDPQVDTKAVLADIGWGAPHE